MSDPNPNEPRRDGPRRLDRRGFFTRGLREFLKPIADAAVERVNEIEAAVAPLTKQITPQITPQRSGDLQARSRTRIASGHLPLLRPPGALAEPDFLNTCSQCQACVNACPADCIKIETQPGGRGGSKPFIIAQESPCVVCSGLECMFVCPSGALVPTRLANIDMGTALWDEQSCLLTNGHQCDACVQACPIGEVAIRIDGQRVSVLDGCTGCGMCEHRCPTRPGRSINVVPREQVA